MPDQLTDPSMPKVGELRTYNGETRTWDGKMWQPLPQGQNPATAKVANPLGMQVPPTQPGGAPGLTGRGLANFAGDALPLAAMFIPGLGEAALPLKVGVQALAGAGSGLLKGEDPFRSAAFQGGLEGGAGILSKGLQGAKVLGKQLPSIPSISNMADRVAQLLGGRRPGQGIADVAKAFEQERAATPWYRNAPRVGDAEKIQALRKPLGAATEVAESGSPAKASLRDLKGFQEDVKLNRAEPISSDKAVRLKTAKFYNETREANKIANPAAPANELDMRTIGEIKRDLAKRGEPVMTLNAEGKPVYSANTSMDAQWSNAGAHQLRDVQVAAERAANGGAPGPIELLNARNSNLASMNVPIQNPRVIGHLGSMTARMAMGGGLGVGANALAGSPLDSRTAGGLGAAAGLLGLPPSNISAMGSAAGHVAGIAPGGYRIARLIADLKALQAESEQPK